MNKISRLYVSTLTVKGLTVFMAPTGGRTSQLPDSSDRNYIATGSVALAST
ncbi:hypothetical protein H7X68_01785 [Candidatus Saccharibacteria bacterium]|nr:hypothetical protein [Candidatus Saccharibacteria bacterium]